MPRPLQVALIGFGMAGRVFHAPIISAVEELNLRFIVTSDSGRTDEAQLSYPTTAVLCSTGDLWARSAEVDLVVIATPNRTHVGLAKTAISRGIAAVVDKPLAPSAEAGIELMAGATEANVLLTVFQNRRYDSDFLALLDLLTKGSLGKVHKMESHFERWRPIVEDRWREDPGPDQAGGILFDIGSHLIDQAIVLFGPVRNVYCEMRAIRRNAQVDDDTFISLQHDSGVVSHLSMSAVASSPGYRFRVLGDEASWEKSGFDVQEQALKDGVIPGSSGWGREPEENSGVLSRGDQKTVIPSPAGCYELFYQQLAKAVQDGKPPPVDPASSVRVLEVIEAAIASSAIAAVVHLS